MNNISSQTFLSNLFKELDCLIEDKIDVYVIGGANLIAQGINNRTTMDIDVIYPETFSSALEDTIVQIAKQKGLDEKWMNTGPSRDAKYLNDGWIERSTLFFNGKSLNVWMVHREDMICLKLTAALDRQIPDQVDLLMMKPSDSEWEVARLWAREYDGNPSWPKLIDDLVIELKEKLSYE